jgi:hypothetical protein
MKIIGNITVFLFTMVFGTIWGGYVLSHLWAWFIVSAFGATPLGIAQCAGLTMVSKFLTFVPQRNKKDERELSEQVAEMLAWAFLYPALVLMTGNVIHHFL